MRVAQEMPKLIIAEGVCVCDEGDGSGVCMYAMCVMVVMYARMLCVWVIVVVCVCMLCVIIVVCACVWWQWCMHVCYVCHSSGVCMYAMMS